MTNSSITPSSLLSSSEQQNLFQKLEIFKIQGRDKRGNQILLIIGKFFPARLVSVEAVKRYLEEKIFPGLNGKSFSIVYVHTRVNKSENFPGISALKLIYEAIPVKNRENLVSFYFLHPGLQSRIFLATCGRLIFTGAAGLYGKLKYVNRLEFLWDNVRRKEMEIPEFVYEFDEEMESRANVGYGLESDHPGIGPSHECSASTYSMRCIA